MLTRPHRQESLCRAYVQAVAAQAGVNYSMLTYDYGIDINLRAIDKVGPHLFDVGIPLDLQLKATTRAKVGAEHVIYDLEVKTYEHLRQQGLGNRRILVLLVLPGEESEWLDQSAHQLVLNGCAFWLSLCGWPTSKARKSTRIAIPRENVFSVTALRSLLSRVQRGENL